MKRTTTRTRTIARIGCTLGSLSALSIASIAGAQVSATSAPAVAAPAAAVSPGVGATLGGGLTPAGTALAVPVSGPTAFGTNPAASAAGSATITNGALNGATGTNAAAIVPGANANNTTGVFATSTPGVSLPMNGATINPGTITTANGTTIPSGALVGGNVVYWPYPIYIPTAAPNAYGGGPAAGSGAQTPSVPGAQASESQEYNEPAPEPQIDYRSIPGGRANTNLDDPAFRAAHIRRW